MGTSRLPLKNLLKTTGYVHGANTPVGIYEKHHYPIHYVGNPTADEVDAFLKEQGTGSKEAFCEDNNLDGRPIPVDQNGKHAAFIGKLLLTFNKK